MSEEAESFPSSSRPAWAHELSLLSLGGVGPVPASLAEVADRLLIQETVHRYAWAYDERRLDVLADIFTPSVTFGFSIRGADYTERSGRDEVVGWLHESMTGQDVQGRHLCGNFLVEELGPETANASIYMVLFASGKSTRPTSTGFYRMTMQKFEGRWRIDRVYNGLDLQPPLTAV